ncbi:MULTISPECIES: hypothetical protein [Alphaproteobacteria]|uniref:DMP19 family protein n=1 Tax=Alphaproteobacteria TaxID=28211 RepID=UPI0026371989|nr:MULTISPECIES: hypothetical protein [Alphaproteobacteria]
MALFGWGKRSTRAVPEQPFHAARVPMPQSIMESDNPSYMTETVVDIVNQLLFDGGFTRAELPPELLMGYSVDYYLAQVRNGGHAQFGHNSRLIEGTLSDIRQGLVAMGDSEAAGIFADFEAYSRDDPAGFTQGLSDGWKNPVMKALDESFYAGPSERLTGTNAAWLKSRPVFEVLEDIWPDSSYNQALRTLVASNPNAQLRNAERKRLAAEAQMRDPLFQTLRFAVERPGSGVEFRHWIGGSQVEIEGYVGGEWGVETSAGRARVLILPHVAIFQLLNRSLKPIATPIAEIKRLVKKQTGQPVPPAAFCTRA